MSEAKDPVDLIIDDLCGRRGLGQEWESIDDEIQQEIRAAWRDFIAGDADFGLPLAQEPKFTVDRETGRLINRATGIAIPDDEPIMIFRAQDMHARKVISYYVNLVTQDDPLGNHKDVCFDRYQAFIAFAEQHAERMKSPDSAPSDDERIARQDRL